MLTAHTVISRRDLDFVLHEWLRLDETLARPRFAEHDRLTIQGILDLAEKIASEDIAPYARAADTQEPAFAADGGVVVHAEVKRAVRLIADSGLFGSVFDAEDGGLQLPFVVHSAAMGLLMSGGVAPASFMMLTVANARLIINFGSPALIDAFARPSIAARAFGTMCMSEPHAGSSLGDITTRAVADGEDALGRRFRLRGAKMWISAADHDIVDNIVHLVLAKTADASGRLIEGTKGISLFVVPKILPNGERNDVTIAGLNHKLGFRGVPNCAVNFGEGAATPLGGPGAVGWLIGEIGDGLRQMFQMMNEARVGVGMGAAMLAYRGYLLSLLYARERRQGRRPGARGGAPVAIIEHADVKRMLLAQKVCAEGGMALVLRTAKWLDDEATAPEAPTRAEAAELLALLTPVAKTWPSENAQASLDLAIQIHGGAGYTRDFQVEQLYRDNRLNPIHEGATGIQAIDLVGRKIRRDGAGAFRLLTERVRATIAATAGEPELATSGQAQSAAWTRIADAIELLIAEPDEARALANATPFLFAFGHAVVGWIWLDVARLALDALPRAVGADKSFYEGKLVACRYFAEYELPRVAASLAPVMSAMQTAATATEAQLFTD